MLLSSTLSTPRDNHVINEETFVCLFTWITVDTVRSVLSNQADGNLARVTDLIERENGKHLVAKNYNRNMISAYILLNKFNIFI